VLWCTFVLDPLSSPPQVAFAIGRAVGPAVTRNLIRRRLRSLLSACSPPLPAGLYLFGVVPDAARRSFTELSADMTKLVTRVRSGVPVAQS
jgi:ribonuclease P protein component